MTYPDNPNALTPVEDIFSKKGRDADKLRERLVVIGMDWFKKCQNERTSRERQWYLNLAFYSGNQHVQFRQTSVNGSFDLYTPKAPYYRVRLVINHIRKVIRKEIARLTAQKPNAFVVPASTEDADVFAAQAGEQIWDSLWRKVHFNKVLREAVFWQSVCGVGFIKTYWDKNKIDKGAGPDGTDVVGDVCITSINPFHLYVPDVMQTDIEEQPYIIHALVKNNSWIKQTFGIDASAKSLDSVDDKLLNVLGVNRNESKKDQSIILEIWVKPGYLPEMPDGGMFIIAAEQIVEGMAHWPYEHGQYPIAKLDGIPTGKFYTASIIEDLIPAQQELNRSRSQLIESKNRMSKPQLMAEEGAVDAKRITTEPGLVIFYKIGMTPPQPLPLQNLPSYVTEEINRLYDDIADLSGQHEVSNGSTPPGVTAATAISFLQEQDESMISTHYTSIEEAIEKVASHCLMFVKMYWDEARTVKIVGIEGTFDVQTFKSSDLRGNSDIRVESGSALPTSRAAKQAFIMDLMKMGFIQPDEGLEILEVGGLNRIYERIQVDNRQAQRENLKMRVITEEHLKQHEQEWLASNPEIQKDIDAGLNLQPPLIIPVHTYDRHELHIELHNRYRKSQNFESASEVTKVLFEEHVRQHEEALSGQMTHPLTGMDPSNPEAPDPATEEDAMAQMEAEQGQGQEQQGTPGPEQMPPMSEDQPERIM
jgi:hypothetical protein